MKLQDRIAWTTARDGRVLNLISVGCPNAEIGALLGIGVDAVKSIVKRLLAERGARNRAHLTAVAWRAGDIHPDESVVLLEEALRQFVLGSPTTSTEAAA